VTHEQPNLPPDVALELSSSGAKRLEYAIIALGIFALALIFQPFSLALFGFGCVLVVLAGLINNLLPLCQPGFPVRSLIRAVLIVALIFCIIMLLSILAAHLYGVLFVIVLAPDASPPFYQMPFVWGVAAMAILAAAAIAITNRVGKPSPGAVAADTHLP
jgi:hypothetical protein